MRTLEAIDDTVSGYGGLFDPRTTDTERRAAVEEVIATGPPSTSLPVASTVSNVVLYVDGSSRGNPGPAGAGAVLQTDASTPTATRIQQTLAPRSGPILRRSGLDE